ncbi:hypothetical protein [Lysobacter sp. Root604]|uniref:hypothetical protein n=1 Tax=Lysobacter sp. Root604 TaxID=1736568 RepID=UPI0006F8BD7E|nr:hypothetical protein [Lysobacter sp. Root604]KRA20778.1 hypothetical protein ASD69_05595 [Lysobacter sp. Root604]
MRGALAAASLMVALAIAPATAASEPGMFCLDRTELAAERKNASGPAQQYIFSQPAGMGIPFSIKR